MCAHCATTNWQHITCTAYLHMHTHPPLWEHKKTKNNKWNKKQNINRTENKTRNHRQRFFHWETFTYTWAIVNNVVATVLMWISCLASKHSNGLHLIKGARVRERRNQRGKRRAAQEKPAQRQKTFVKRCKNARCTWYLSIHTPKMRYRHRSNSNEWRKSFFRCCCCLLIGMANTPDPTWCAAADLCNIYQPLSIRSLCTKVRVQHT